GLGPRLVDAVLVGRLASGPALPVDLPVSIVVEAVVAGGVLDGPAGILAARIEREVGEPVAVVVEAVVAGHGRVALARVGGVRTARVREVHEPVAVVVDPVGAGAGRRTRHAHLERAREDPAAQHRARAGRRVHARHQAAAARAVRITGAGVGDVDRAARTHGHALGPDPARVGGERAHHARRLVDAEHALAE